MRGKPKKSPREKDLTSRYLSGGLDEDRVESQERFTARSKNAQQNKTEKTAALRAEGQTGEGLAGLPLGQVRQVYSLYSEVAEADTGQVYLCTVRKTLNKVSSTAVIVGDVVRFRPSGRTTESGQPEGVVEEVLPRRTVLTRSDSFKGLTQHPIVANADQMLVVASLHEPDVKWGLIDRMLVAAQSGGLSTVVCLNKVDLGGAEDLAEARAVLAHYASLGIATVEASASTGQGLERLRELIAGKVTVLAGHSGVGKSSLVHAVQPNLDLRVGEVSAFTGKGRHTTTSARHYFLSAEDTAAGALIDTPGVKLFGLWGVTADNLDAFFPDVENETAPAWRRESYRRIAASVGRGS